MIVPLVRRSVPGTERAERAPELTDTAWQGLDVAFRAWASAPTGERYRALLDADRRWREAAATQRSRPRRAS